MVIKKTDTRGDGPDERKEKDEVGADDVLGYVKQNLRYRTPEVVVP
jgi:hypothetical protein